MCAMSGRYCTVQFRCVQIAENARSSPRAVRIREGRTVAKLENIPGVRLHLTHLDRHGHAGHAGFRGGRRNEVPCDRVKH